MTAFAPLHFGTKKKCFLVTGATGFIGQQLVGRLLADGHDVVALTRRPRQARETLGAQVQCIDSLDQLPPAQKIDVVVNLAGARILGAPWTAARRQVLIQSRVGLTRALTAWMHTATQKPDLLLSASAIGFYGVQAAGDDSALMEEQPPQDIFMSQLCREWEAAARAAQDVDVQVTCCRLGVVFGRRGALPMMLLPIRLGLGGRLGRGSQWLSWIHIEDVLAGFAHLISLHEHSAASLASAYNFTAPDTVTQAQFSQQAADVLHRPCCFPTPAWPMRLVLGEQSDLLLEGQRVSSQRLQASGYVFRYPALKGALENLR